jgi:peptidoglycan/LPS O-acetylase OafA/YrhL
MGMADVIGGAVRHHVAVKERRDGKRFIGHLHAFRGFAILNIVAAHALSGQVWRVRNSEPSLGVSVLSAVGETLFHDSTLYFALISGLLFTLALQSRGWTPFFKSKLLNVVSPYIVLTMLFTWYGLNMDYELAGPFKGEITDYFATVVGNLVSGGAIYQLWYIPVLIMLYLSTPLLVWLMADARMRWLIWPIMLAPLIVPRATWPDFSWTTPVYFLGAYAVGMFVGARYETSLVIFFRYRNLLLLAVILATPALIAAHLGEIDKLGPLSMRETLWYVQKLAFAAVVLVFLHAQEARLPQWINTLGTYAFPIYFLHAIFLVIFEAVQFQLAPDAVSAVVLLPAGAVSLVFAIAVSLVLSALAKHAFGKHSRLLLGA